MSGAHRVNRPPPATVCVPSPTEGGCVGLMSQECENVNPRAFFRFTPPWSCSPGSQPSRGSPPSVRPQRGLLAGGRHRMIAARTVRKPTRPFRDPWTPLETIRRLIPLRHGASSAMRAVDVPVALRQKEYTTARIREKNFLPCFDSLQSGRLSASCGSAEEATPRPRSSRLTTRPDVVLPLVNPPRQDRTQLKVRIGSRPRHWTG